MPDNFYLEKVFPEADKVFSFEHKNIQEVKDDCVYVFDTMVLLVPYFTSKESVQEFSRIFKDLKKGKRLFIPARVAREFAKNRGQKIAETYNKIIESQDRLNKAEISLERFPIFETNSDYARLKDIEGKINALKSEYREKLNALSDDLMNWKWNDPVSLIYKDVFTPETIIELKETAESLAAKMQFRFEHGVPPGFKKKDQAKPDEGIGDLIIWQVTLEIGKETNSNVVLVTNEEHKDWFYRHQNTAILPKYELIEEFRRYTGGKSINIINFSKFLKLQNAQEKTVEEVKSLYADTGFKIIKEKDFLSLLKENEKYFTEKNGFLGAKYFVETVLAGKEYDIGSSWELMKNLDGKKIECYPWKDPTGKYHPLNAVRIKKHNSSAEMSNELKINRQLVTLKANIPIQIFVNGGIDYYDTEFSFRYNPPAYGKGIVLSLKDANGQIAAQYIILDSSGQMTYRFSDAIDELGIERNFGFVEIKSKEDVTFELWAKDIEGGFQ